MQKDNLTKLIEDVQARGYYLSDFDNEILKVLCSENTVVSHYLLSNSLKSFMSEFENSNSDLLVRLARLNKIGLIHLERDNISLKIGCCSS